MSRRRAHAAVLICVAGAALAQDRAPPTPGDPDDFVRWLFETHDCVMTEADLLAGYRAAGLGLMGANNAVIAVANRDDVEVIGREPFTHRFLGSEFCGF